MQRNNEMVYHRGLGVDQKKPNSFEAIRERFDSRIECDVFLLADGTLAVIHDKQDINMDKEGVEAMTSQAFNDVYVRDRKTGEVGARAPFFREYLFLALDRNNHLIAEIKASTPDQAVKTAEAIVGEIASFLEEEYSRRKDETLKSYVESSVELHSFSVEGLNAAGDALRKRRLALPRGLLWSSSPVRAHEMKISETVFACLDSRGIPYPKETRKKEYSAEEIREWGFAGLEVARQNGYNSFNPHESIITQELVDLTHVYGLKMNAWVVDSPLRIKELKKIGVDHIISESQQ